MAQQTVHHHGISVTDLDRAIEFYRDVLGLELLDQYTLSDDALSTAIESGAITGHFAQLGGDTARVELIEYESEDEGNGTGTSDDGRDVYETGAKHLGLETDDIEGIYADLPDDVETVSEPQTTGSGTRICFLRDPDGNAVELLEL
ncbi:VOC family protein [Haladaptatus sp. DYF46]|uniref:VOC family protein n=1 Tax=Haladaptatus sp. DYF46 TaxID=2886041 RepID=UPI001E3434E8|nr:VOC family protein [Haladaptatus sp. DYF46]